MESKLSGNPIPVRASSVLWEGRGYPLRLFAPQALLEHEPRQGVNALAYQMSDLHQVILMGLVSLAKDVYARQPEGSREFQSFVKSLGIKFRSETGELTDAAELLAAL